MNRWQAIIKLRAEINKREKNRIIQTSMKQQVGCLRNQQTIQNLFKLSKRNRENIKINKIWN